MRSTLALVAAFAAAAFAAPQGVTADITPTAAAPAGCTDNYPYFELSVVTLSKAKRDIVERTTLEIELVDGQLTDNFGRKGYIASNDQFQFDAIVPQAGAIYTGGFSVCANGTLALGGSAIWWECLSGTFYNLYDEDIAAQCKAIFLDTILVSGSVSVTTVSGTSTATAITASTSSVASAGATSDGQVTAPTTTSAVTTSISVSVSSAATTSAVTTSVAAVSTVAIVTSISDYQIQAPTTSSVTTYNATTSATTYNSTTSATLASYTGAASQPTAVAQFVLAAAGVAALML